MMIAVFKMLQQIAYIPNHAEGNIDHPGTEFGFSPLSATMAGPYSADTGASTTLTSYVLRLTVKAHPADNLVHHSSHTNVQVLAAYDQFAAPQCSAPSTLPDNLTYKGGR